MLKFPNGDLFATGSITYLYQPAHEWEQTPRILVPVEIEGIPVLAVLDTGAPYVVCTPQIAVQAGLQLTGDRSEVMLAWHGLHTGYLVRHDIRFKAVNGAVMVVAATMFVPDTDSEQAWETGRRPFILGMGGCLERMRFAVDPANDLFYFGPLEQS